MCVLNIMLPLPELAHRICDIDRVQRLKDARAEAQKEIDEYRKAKDAEFSAFQSSVRHLV
jgi:hypothetical protein